MDTGADTEMAVVSLVDEIESLGLAHRYPLKVPIGMGSIDSPSPVFTITHAIDLPQRIGDKFFHWTYGVADIPGPPHIILGKPWMEAHCPDVIKTLKEFGRQAPGTERGPLKGLGKPKITPAYYAKTNPQRLGPAPGEQLPLVAGGGVFSSLPTAKRLQEALIAYDHDQEYARCCAMLAMRLQNTVRDALDDREYGDRIARTCQTGKTTKDGDPGVRGLTANQEGWLDTVPEEWRHFASDVFSNEAADTLPPFRPGYDCRITLKDGARLTTAKVYDMSQEQLTVLKQLLDHELKVGFIRPSKAPHAAPVFFVRDPPSDSRGKGQLRLVVDYRELNRESIRDAYPLPLIRSVNQRLGKAVVASVFDVRGAFRRIRMEEGSAELAAFIAGDKLYEPTVMPMGLANAPAVFQRFMNSILAPVAHCTFVYLDDVLVYSSSMEEHQRHIQQVLEIFRANQLQLKPHKCRWYQTTFNFLGFTFELGKGMRMADDKIQGIRDMTAPRNVSELRMLLGKMGWGGQDLTARYSDLTACLTDLQKKDAKWEWTARHEEAFQRLKYELCRKVYLRVFDPALPIIASSDASNEAFGGVLEQEYADGRHPFLMYSHKFKDGEKGWDVPDKELYAIVYALKRYRSFLAQPAHTVRWFTDHRNLAKFLFSTNLLKSHDGRLGRWYEEVSQCNIEIQYVPGEENLVPDFLSRYGHPVEGNSDPRVLLPLGRFSPKAQADIKQWFKQNATDKNIRQILEESFADVPDELEKGPSTQGAENNGSGTPVPTPPAPPPPVAGCRATAPPPRQPRERLVADSLTPRQQRLAASLGLATYVGTKLATLLPTDQCRRGRSRLGLGA